MGRQRHTFEHLVGTEALVDVFNLKFERFGSHESSSSKKKMQKQI
jgi:hypothetical protein